MLFDKIYIDENGKLQRLEEPTPKQEFEWLEELDEEWVKELDKEIEEYMHQYSDQMEP